MKFGITVNGVAPGFFATESNVDVVADQEIAVWLEKRTSLGRWGDPEEIAGAVVFFASPAAHRGIAPTNPIKLILTDY